MVDLTQVLVTILGTLVPVLISLLSLAYWLGGKFSSIDERFKAIDEKFKMIDRRFEELREYIDSRITKLAEASRASQEFFIEYLSVKGLLKPTEVSMIKSEFTRLLNFATLNPLTKEEWEKIKRYLEKDELTLEEALEFRRLARKVTDEYGHLTEAWKLHIYASIMVGWAMRKKLEEEGKIEEGRQES